MFTGIVESMGEILDIKVDGLNKSFVIGSELTPELKIDQSISHNGVCLTVEYLIPGDNSYQVSAIHETLRKTTLHSWATGHHINIERAMMLDQRLDGHMVQGHVDRTITCLDKLDQEGSVYFTFTLPPSDRHLVIPRGSITLDGISLTVADVTADTFSVAVIPYTFHHTVAQYWKPGWEINVEYDVFGKYLARYRELYVDNMNQPTEMAL